MTNNQTRRELKISELEIGKSYEVCRTTYSKLGGTGTIVKIINKRTANEADATYITEDNNEINLFYADMYKETMYEIDSEYSGSNTNETEDINTTCPECLTKGEYINGAYKCPKCWKTWI